MRIFKDLEIDLKDIVPFNDTLEYVDKAFEKLGITYDNMGFDFTHTHSTINDFVEKYPELAKYMKPSKFKPEIHSTLSTIRDYVFHDPIPKEEHKILRELVKNSPLEYEFASNFFVFLEDVRFSSELPEINTAPCIGGHVLSFDYWPRTVMSNSVSLTNGYNRNRNRVRFTIEVGDGKGGIIDTAALEERISAVFGKPFDTENYEMRYVFHFDKEEKARLDELDKTFNNIFQPLMKELGDMVNNSIKSKESRPVRQTSGFSLAKAFRKALPKNQYECKCSPRMAFSITNVNENNHVFELDCRFFPKRKEFNSQITVYGYNFYFSARLISIYLNDDDNNDVNTALPHNQEELEYYCVNLVAAFIKAEETLSGELLRIYGKSLVY